tara:strand:- start:678 stop:1256 length:579 start_codon:yes stop_codon:yes gene_type:complete
MPSVLWMSRKDWYPYEDDRQLSEKQERELHIKHKKFYEYRPEFIKDVDRMIEAYTKSKEGDYSMFKIDIWKSIVNDLQKEFKMAKNEMKQFNEGDTEPEECYDEVTFRKALLKMSQELNEFVIKTNWLQRDQNKYPKNAAGIRQHNIEASKVSQTYQKEFFKFIIKFDDTVQELVKRKNKGLRLAKKYTIYL